MGKRWIPRLFDIVEVADNYGDTWKGRVIDIDRRMCEKGEIHLHIEGSGWTFATKDNLQIVKP